MQSWKKKGVHKPIERYYKKSGNVIGDLFVLEYIKSVWKWSCPSFNTVFLHDIPINNYWFNTWKLCDDWLFTFCSEEIEDRCHLFWECHFTQNNFQNIFCIKNLTKNDILFGMHGWCEGEFLDFLCQIIYSQCKNCGNNKIFLWFHIIQCDMKNIEYIIAKKNAK